MRHYVRAYEFCTVWGITSTDYIQYFMIHPYWNIY